MSIVDPTSDPKYQRIIEIIAEVSSAVLKHELVPSSIIQIDCGIEGDDAEELLLKIQEEFHVDFSTFEFGKYFHDEAGMSLGMALLPIAPLCWAVMRLTKTGGKVDLTVQDFFDSVIAGRWIAPERPAKYPWERRRNKPPDLSS